MSFNIVYKFLGDSRDLDKTFDRVNKKSGALAGVAATAFKASAIAVGTLTAAVGVASQAFDKQAKAENALLTALKGREDVQERLISQASELQSRTLFSDQEVLQQQAYLATLGLTEQQISDVISASLDLASVSDLELGSAVKNLARTYSGLFGELGEAIPTIRNLSQEQLKAGAAIDVVADAFEGQAEAAALTDVTLTQARNKLGDVVETFGRVFAPAVRELNKGLLDSFGTLDEFLKSERVEQFAIKSAATVRAVFISAGDEIERASLRGEQALLEFGNFFQDLATDLANSSLGSLIFSDEDIANSNANSREIATRLAEIQTRLFDLNEDGKKFGVEYANAIIDVSNGYDDFIEALSKKPSGGFDFGGETKEVDDYQRALDRVLDSIEKNAFLEEGLDPIKGPTRISEDITVGKIISDDEFAAKFPEAPPVPELETGVEELDAYALQLERLKEVYGSVSQAADAFTESIDRQNDAGITGAKAYANAAVAAIKTVLIEQVRLGVISAATKALEFLPPPFNIIGAGIAAGAAQALLQGLLSKIPSFHDGGVMPKDGLAYLHAGEIITNPALGQTVGGGSHNVYVRGVVFGNQLNLLQAQQNALNQLISA